MILTGELTTLQIIFIIATVVVVIALSIIISIPLTKRHHKKHFNEHCHKAIYKVAFDEDYYLINNFSFKVDSSKVAKIDHLLFGNKYIYVILDTYIEGNLTGNEEDKSLIVINKQKQKFYLDNQYTIVKTILTYLSNSTGIDKDLLIGIVLVNDDCKISIETTSKQFYVIQRNKIKKLVKAIESRDVPSINAKELEAAVQDINKSNRTKKNDHKRSKK